MNEKLVIGCPDCGGHNIGGAPAYYAWADTSSGLNYYQCVDCGAIIRHRETSYGPDISVVTHGGTDKLTAKSFAGRSETELGEILVALDLLAEYSELLEYLKKLRDAVCGALVDVRMEATNG